MSIEAAKQKGECMIYNLTISGIDGNGHQYITGMLEPERLNSYGLRIGKAFSFEIYHRKNKTELWTFMWVHGAPNNWERIAVFPEETIVESEIEKLLKKYSLLEEVSNAE